MSDTERPVATFDEPVDADERGDIALEDAGGLPDDNPFTEVVEQLRENGDGWEEIWRQMDEAYDAVDVAAGEAMVDLFAEWRVTAIVPGETSTSGKSYAEHVVTAETPEDAEQEVLEKPEVLDVDRTETEQDGYFKAS